MISRTNNFDLIRLFAALQVAVSHTMEHLEYQQVVQGGVKFPFSGVICFFVISGFLITSSWDRNPSFTKYIKNRFLRIIPALWTAFFILVIVLACFGYINSATIKRPQFWFYCVGQLTLFQFYTPDFLRTFGVGCPNGSLWTIPVEFVFYLILPLLIYYTRQCKNIGLIIVSALSITINVLISKFGDGGIIFKLIGCSVFPWLYSFLLGSILYLNWDKVSKFFVGKGVFYILLWLLYVNLFAGPQYNFTDIYPVIANYLLGLMTISLAFTFPKCGSILKGYDISYGIYVYHMIVVNIFVHLRFVGEFKYVISALFISICISLLSWNYIEKKALLRKN